MYDKLWWCVQVRDIAPPPPPPPPTKNNNNNNINTTKQTKTHHNWQKYWLGKSRDGQRVVSLLIILLLHSSFMETVHPFWGDKLYTQSFSLPLPPVQPLSIFEGCPSMCFCLCAQTMVWLPMPVVCNMHTDRIAHGGCMAIMVVCSDGWLGEENPLLCREVQPASAAWQTLPPTRWWAISLCHS